MREYDVFSNLTGTFLEDMAEAGYPPETLDTVLCTHLHLDHCGWNTHKVDGKWVAIRAELTAADLAHTVHAHPTLAEAWMEAAHVLMGEHIHSAPPRKQS